MCKPNEEAHGSLESHQILLTRLLREQTVWLKSHKAAFVQWSKQERRWEEMEKELRLSDWLQFLTVWWWTDLPTDPSLPPAEAQRTKEFENQYVWAV